MVKKLHCLILSAHDYRTDRQANMHFIADSLQKKYNVSFFSLRFSFLSLLKGDYRWKLNKEANVVVRYKGIDCYLWRSIIHFFSLKFSRLNRLERLFSRYYCLSAPLVLKNWIRQADYIIFESGTAALFTAYAKKLNAKAKLIYLASDLLETINAAHSVQVAFKESAYLFDTIAITSPRMRNHFPAKNNVIYVPHGIDSAIRLLDVKCPFNGGVNAISIGSMLFDSDFFNFAATFFPNIKFHIIGSGSRPWRNCPANIIWYEEMPFLHTIAFMKYADFGIAPYFSEKVHPYLADTSMKLMYYDFFGLPSVCPNALADGYPMRFGYESNHTPSIAAAISSALASRRISSAMTRSWDEVVSQLIPTE